MKTRARRTAPAIDDDRKFAYCRSIVESHFGPVVEIETPNRYLTIGGMMATKGFWDGYEEEFDPAPPEEARTAFVEEDEKAEIIEGGITLWVHDVRLSPTQFGTRFFLDVTIGSEDGDHRTLGFDAEGRVESRDKLLAKMRAYYRSDNGGKPTPIMLVQKGRAILVERA